MEEKQFFAECIHPTSTLGKGKKYEIINEDTDRITILNDNGLKVSLLRERFGPVLMENKVSESGVLCVSRGRFKSITSGITYKIEKESNDFYYIINDNSKSQKYGKKYFKKILSNKDKPDSEKIMKAVCVFPVNNETSYDKAYTFIDGKENFIEITNDMNKKSSYLKKRFKYQLI